MRCRGSGSALLSRAGRERRQEEDGDKVGHFTAAIVFDSEHLLQKIQHRCLPQGLVYINQSDKRDAATAFLSLQLPAAMKEPLLTLTLNARYCVCSANLQALWLSYISRPYSAVKGCSVVIGW